MFSLDIEEDFFGIDRKTISTKQRILFTIVIYMAYETKCYRM